MTATASRRQPAPAVTNWFASVAGRALLLGEREALHGAAQERPGQAGLWLGPSPESCGDAELPLLRLHAAPDGLAGALRCSLPLPLASESCGVVVVQHLADLSVQPGDLLDECARVLLPGARLWLLALNPLSPYRLRWRGQGVRAAEPVTWRRRLRAVGLTPEPVSQGVGPVWALDGDASLQDGAGLRAAYLLRAEKRRLPLTPIRRAPTLQWRPGLPAA